MKELITQIETEGSKSLSTTIDELKAELTKIENDLSYGKAEATSEVKKVKMGTVEPIHKVIDKVDYEVIGFVRGLVTKYKDVKLDVKEVLDYLEKLVK
jgi:ribosomal protein L29